jgi:hypothetical protein
LALDRSADALAKTLCDVVMTHGLSAAAQIVIKVTQHRGQLNTVIDRRRSPKFGQRPHFFLARSVVFPCSLLPRVAG